MTTLSLQIPQAGQPNSTEDPKIASSLTSIQAWAGGQIDGTNVAATLTGRRLVMSTFTALASGSMTGATTWLFAPGGGAISGNVSSGQGWVSLDPANYAITGKANTQLILRFGLVTNAVAPTINFTAALAPVTFTSQNNGVIGTAGAAVTGSSVAFNTPGANTNQISETSAFTFPAAGAYGLTFSISGAAAANAGITASLQLFVVNS